MREEYFKKINIPWFHQRWSFVCAFLSPIKWCIHVYSNCSIQMTDLEKTDRRRTWKFDVQNLNWKMKLRKQKNVPQDTKFIGGPRGKTNKNLWLYELDLDLCFWVGAIAQVEWPCIHETESSNWRFWHRLLLLSQRFLWSGGYMPRLSISLHHEKHRFRTVGPLMLELMVLTIRYV
jgi:hypothetical protein